MPNSTTRTPATDTLYNTTNGHHQRTSSQQLYNKFATSQCQSPTSRHVKMLGCGKFLSVGGEFVYNYSCRIIVSSSVGGVIQHVRSRCPCSGVWHLHRKWLHLDNGVVLQLVSARTSGVRQLLCAVRSPASSTWQRCDNNAQQKYTRTQLQTEWISKGNISKITEHNWRK